MLKVFVTGGAGFIGRNLIQQILAMGNDVLAYDSLLPQVHGFYSQKLNLGCPLIVGDIRNEDLLYQTISTFRPDITYHLAAETGTGQSADEYKRYLDVNITGTCNLISALSRASLDHHRFVLASSRAVYGEGAYVDNNGTVTTPVKRSIHSMANGDFCVYDESGNILKPIPTAESAPLLPDSIYASSKMMQELLLLQSRNKLDSRILRFQNVYGPGQSTSNPYTGVLSIFASQVMQCRPLDIFEDGLIVRDFIYVADVVNALILIGFADKPPRLVYNVGTGIPSLISDAARILISLLEAHGYSSKIVTSGRFRKGDIRYAVADVKRIQEDFGWTAYVDLNEGLKRLVGSLVS